MWGAQGEHMSVQLPAQLTLLITDVVDSTQLNDQLGDAVMGPLWAAHDGMSRTLMQRWRAREIGRSDGFLLLFEQVADAVGFALAYHRCLGALTVPLKARVGIHTGPVTLRENTVDAVARGAPAMEVDGLALPFASRVMSAAMGQQTLLTAHTKQALDVGRSPVHGDGAFAPDPAIASLRTQSHGYWLFKGLTEPVEVFEIGDDTSPFTPPPDAAKAYRVVRSGVDWLPARELPHKLPAERDSFVGREDALLALARRFDKGERLVSLLGLGGMGKTRLSTRYARSWLGEYAGGAWFCDLSAAQGPDGIVHAVAQALEVPLDKTDPIQLLGAAIAGRGHCLVILDNFEQVARHAEETLGVWMAKAPEARFIVTSREVLGIVGEHAMLLAPLKMPEAEQLLRDRMRAAGHEEPFGGQDEAAIGPLVELLDRLPLAIELAAARVRVMPPATLLARMGERFRLLASRGGRHDRQATLRSALDWSWDLLSAPEKSALAQCSVFEGGFTLTAVEAVLDLSAIDSAPWVADLMQALVEKSLLRRSADDRFDLLRSVHDYAAEHLATGGRFEGSGEIARMSSMQRHWRYFASLDERAATANRCADADNLVAACRRATQAGETDSAAAALVVAWAALRLTGPFSVAVILAERLLASDPSRALAVMGWVQFVLASANHLLADVDRARELFEAALSTPGDPKLTCRTCCALGLLESNAGNSERACALLQRALRVADETGDDEIRCHALFAMGSLCAEQSRMGDAREHFEAALHIARSMRNAGMEGGILGNLGLLDHTIGNAAAGRHYYQDALSLSIQTGDRTFEGNTRCNLGFLCLEEGALHDALEHFRLALAIARTTGHVELRGILLCNMALAEEALGQIEPAIESHRLAVESARSLGHEREQGQFLTYLGRLLGRLGRLAESQEMLALARPLLENTSDYLSQGLLKCAQAEAACRAGDVVGATCQIASAQSLLDKSGAGSSSELGREIERLQSSVTAC